MEERELLLTIELTDGFRDRTLDIANELLNSPEAAIIKVDDFLSTDLENQTILKTISAKPN